jgi:hypothetical protein
MTTVAAATTSSGAIPSAPYNRLVSSPPSAPSSTMVVPHTAAVGALYRVNVRYGMPARAASLGARVRTPTIH